MTSRRGFLAAMAAIAGKPLAKYFAGQRERDVIARAEILESYIKPAMAGSEEHLTRYWSIEYKNGAHPFYALPDPPPFGTITITTDFDVSAAPARDA